MNDWGDKALQLLEHENINFFVISRKMFMVDAWLSVFKCPKRMVILLILSLILVVIKNETDKEYQKYAVLGQETNRWVRVSGSALHNWQMLFSDIFHLILFRSCT